jgi:hypothetical protein
VTAATGAGSAAGNQSRGGDLPGHVLMGDAFASQLDMKRGMSEENMSMKQRGQLHNYVEDRAGHTSTGGAGAGTGPGRTSGVSGTSTAGK